MIVQHPQRATGDRWRGCIPRLLQSATPYRQALRPTPHSASASVQMSNWLSLRFRDASVGIISLALIVFAVMLFPLAASFGAAELSIRRVFSILFFFFPPAILGGLYSLFFEKSKLYGCLSILLASIVLLVQPLVRPWLSLYSPVGLAFTVFCALVWALERRLKP